ncbi:hypothetical protein ABZV64_18570, partial [Streptomyces sp. NPDC004959]|uniref:hypothetical protein n=1 Tax=Streptomyces sp. NPDC004959 TaxID=3154673 RepID=UPI0033A55407
MGETAYDVVVLALVGGGVQAPPPPWCRDVARDVAARPRRARRARTRRAPPCATPRPASLDDQ